MKIKLLEFFFLNKSNIINIEHNYRQVLMKMNSTNNKLQFTIKLTKYNVINFSVVIHNINEQFQIILLFRI